ncbi:hypothetical protein SEA_LORDFARQUAAD_58 [Gordonia phage LordFarquaad]|uniref:Uncharacterized protein n=3 Tax=Attisvirus attis TaxID=2169707 RepID=A0A142K8U8_9CAUD|nr:hypothetical protein SEA_SOILASSASSIN_56 [Gordonia phage SoilAssassin]YP_009595814.1 hypothetical protein FDH00_gp56 [Gordonia phage Attis]AMS02457.1 hypothetical protein SEA_SOILASSASSIN_56 [Gordonia phage SoilAssassin]AMS02531.1 hypothetical protein SEA_ATTIS_56 [Gordonia phage Attis]QDF18378.1 hypothetical protein SEA_LORDFARQUAAD_58 [Gordonia phage LordFarquaad]
MSDDVRADARRLLQGITPGPWSVDYETSDCYPYERYAYAISGPRNTGLDVPHVSDEYRAQYGNQMSEIAGISDADAEFIAAAPALVQGLLAEGEPAPCDMKQGAPYDFAWCETHDTTFALGEKCKFDGREPWEVFADEANEQRQLKVRAELSLDLTRGQLDAALATIQRIRAFGVDCVTNGDMTPAGKLMLDRILDGGVS